MLHPQNHHNLWDFNCASTTWSKCVKGIWNSYTGTVVRIELMVVLTAINILFMATFGSQRRQSRNFFIQKGVLGAYALSSSLVSYTLGLMQSSTVKSNMFPIWAISLSILFSCIDSITAYSLDDNYQYTRLNYQLALDSVYLLMIVQSVPDNPITVMNLYTIVAYKFMHRLLVFKLVTKSWNLNKVVADYMYEEHMKSGSSYDPVRLKGYHYLVDWPLHKSILEARTSYSAKLSAEPAQVIDIERIWLCNGGLLSPELKDACLSFSLFHLLRRRFYGFSCGESSQLKTHDFVFKGLLAKSKDGTVDYNRVFRVIDVELAFMYDFFFTKYAVLYYGSKASTFWSLAVASLVLFTACTAPKPKFYPAMDVIVNSTTTRPTIVVTVVILASIGLLELLQLLLYWTTIWGRVTFVCQYVREHAVNSRGSCFMRLKEILTKIGVSFASKKYYYRDKLGQYSLVDSVTYDPNPSMAGVDVPVRRKYNRFCHLLDSSPFHHNMHQYARWVRNRQPGKPVKVPTEVKQALLHSLQRTDGMLTNGESSLLSNGAYHLVWACKNDVHSVLGARCSLEKENQAHIILTWHIATCYCKMATLKCLSPKVGGQLKFNFDVATKLSRYCAYLVVSAPKLLPGHHYDTTCMFDALIAEAAQLLAGDKYVAMRSLHESAEMTIFPMAMGMKLGKQLQEMEEGTCWKLLADFWAELLLYVAPLDNVKEHIECLAKGGEFLTHLWALLSDAGILDRGQKNVVDIETARADQSSPGEESHGDALRFRRASSHPMTCAEKRAAIDPCAPNQPAMSKNHVECGRTATSGQGSGNEEVQGVAT